MTFMPMLRDLKERQAKISRTVISLLRKRQNPLNEQLMLYRWRAPESSLDLQIGDTDEALWHGYRT